MLRGKKKKKNRNSDISNPIVKNTFRLRRINTFARFTLFSLNKHRFNCIPLFSGLKQCSAFGCEIKTKQKITMTRKIFTMCRACTYIIDYEIYLYPWSTYARSVTRSSKGTDISSLRLHKELLFVFQFIGAVISNNQDHSWHFSLQIVTHYISSHSVLRYCSIVFTV
jgi:hypothetical protein